MKKTIALCIVFTILPLTAALAGEAPKSRTNSASKPATNPLRQLETRVGAGPGGEAKNKPWFENIIFKGDFRFRHEFISAVTDSGDPVSEDSSTRARERIRLRACIEAAVNKDWSLFAGICSGGDDPTSTNQTFGDAFSSKEIMLDYAFFNWKAIRAKKDPENKRNTRGLDLEILAGKMKNPFFKPTGSQLLFDGDVRPEGLCAKLHAYTKKGLFVPFALLGNYWLDELSTTHEDPMLGVFQAGGKILFRKAGTLTVGAGYFGFNNLKGGPLLNDGGTGKSKGNTDDGLGNYTNSYYVTNFFVEYGRKVKGVPARVFIEIVSNSGADDDNRGYVFGFKAGSAKKPGGWEASYYFRRCQADSVVGGLTQSEFLTDAFGHCLGFTYCVGKGAKVGAAYYITETGLKDEYPDEKKFLRLEVNLSF